MATAQWQPSGLSASRQDTRPQTPESQPWIPHRIGPRFYWLDYNRIMVVDGPLSERQFEIATDIRPDTATVRLREDGHFAGQVHIERDPPGEGVILSNAAVGKRLRGGGLAAVMTWCAFRELLTTQESATFRIRTARTVTPYAPGIGRRIGMGVIAARLGFRPDLPIEEMVRGDNVTTITALPGDDGHPPALKIMLRSSPFVLLASALSPDTMRPITDYRAYQQLKPDDNLILRWLRQGLLLVDSGYRLGDSGIERFVNALATDEEEAALFRDRVRGL